MRHRAGRLQAPGDMPVSAPNHRWEAVVPAEGSWWVPQAEEHRTQIRIRFPGVNASRRVTVSLFGPTAVVAAS